MPPLETRLVERAPVAVRRGIFKLDRIRLIGGDPAGFFAREKMFHYPDEVIVFPEVEHVTWIPLRLRKQMQFSIEGRPLGISGFGQDFFGVREYLPSDGIRFIHWKASARHNQLLVREFEAHAVSRVGIILDVDRRSAGPVWEENNFEFLIKVAASITDCLATMYCRSLFVSGNPDESRTPMLIEGEAQSVKQRIIHELASLKPMNFPFVQLLDGCLEQFRSNSILYCLTMSEPTGIADRFNLLLDQGVDIRWILAPSDAFLEFPPPSRREVPVQEAPALKPFIADRETRISRVLSYG